MRYFLLLLGHVCGFAFAGIYADIVSGGDLYQEAVQLREEEVIELARNDETVLCSLDSHSLESLLSEEVEHYLHMCPENSDLLHLKGTMLISRKMKPNKESDPIALFRLSAQAGNSMAQYKLGVAYSKGYIFQETGMGVQKDIDKSIYWLKRSIENKNSSAMNALAELFLFDLENPKKAFEYFSMAAKSGDARGLYMAAWLLELGRGTEKDLGKAVHLYQVAAEDGYTQAWARIGNIFLKGREGIPIDEVAARKAYTIGANNGNPECQLAIGILLLSGVGGDKDKSQAIEYLKLAKNNGEKNASIILIKLGTD